MARNGGIEKLFEEISDPQNRCIGCDGFCTAAERYCPWCGRENARFDSAEFIRKNDGKTLAESIQEDDCVHGHPLACADRLVTPEVHDVKFCILCGKRYAVP